MESDQRSTSEASPSPTTRSSSNNSQITMKISGTRKPQQGPAGHKSEVGRYVMRAIRGLKERNGSTAREIKKYMADRYSVDIKARSAEIAQFIKSGVQSGQLLKSQGKYRVGAGKKKRSAGKRSGKAPGSRSKSRKSGKKASGSRRKARPTVARFKRRAAKM